MRTIEVATDNFIERSASAVECKGLTIAAKKRQRGDGTRECWKWVLGAWCVDNKVRAGSEGGAGQRCASRTAMVH
jgi:hypothetical protein